MKPTDSVPYNQPTVAPTPKVAAAGIAGSLTVVLVYITKQLFNIDIPAEVGAALATVLAFVSAYMTRARKPLVEVLPTELPE